MLKICFLYLSVSLIAMLWAMNRLVGIILLHVIVAAWFILMVHDYGEGKYLKGIYTATHLNHYSLGGK